MMKKTMILLMATGLMQACSKVDDYMLGKDNTPKPSALEKITPKMDLVKNWSSPVGQSRKANAYLKLKPVILGNVIYTADTSGRIQAMNKSSGKSIWMTQQKQSIVSGPTVKQDVLAVTTGASTLVLLDSRNGKHLWESKLSSEALAKPAISDNKVVVKTIDGNLYAFNLQNGEKLWVVNHGAPKLILKAGSSPIIVGDKILAGYSDGKLDAVDLNTGRLLWQRSIAYAKGASEVERLIDIDADPIVKGNIAYLATYQGYIGALSLTNGEFIWNKEASVYKNMALAGNTLYMTDSHDVVWALNANTGKVKWKQTGLKSRGLTEPVIVANQVVVGDRTGLLHVMSTKTGEFLARTQVAGAVDISPIVENNKLFVQTANGLLNEYSVS